MKDDVLEVLMFIFEHFYDNESDYAELDEDLPATLEQCGFVKSEIEKALQWLDDLIYLREQEFFYTAGNPTSCRVYATSELEKLNKDCRGFIMFMEQMKILDCHTREMVIDRAVALEGEEVDIERLKWVVMMVLYNMPDKEGECIWMENLGSEWSLH